MGSNLQQASWSEQTIAIRPLVRRLREEPLDAVYRIAGDIGPRRATSLAEAQTAAYLDGRLRRDGLRVSVDTFLAPVSVGWDGLLLGLLTVLCAALYYWFPLPSLALSLWSLAFAGWRLTRPMLPLLVPRRASQNVIGTRALERPPRWRVVLIAPIDSPPLMSRFEQWLTAGLRPLIGRAVACVLLALLMMAGLLDLRPLWWYAQFLPVIYMLLTAVVDLRVMRTPGSPGAVSHAGALAVMLASAEALSNTQHIELWTVGLGATSSSAGWEDLFRRYPFERDKTVFIGLEGLGSGTLAYLTREGALRNQPADPLLLRLAAAADAANPLIDIEPRVYRGSPTIASILRRRGWRTLTVTCLANDGSVPYRSRRDDTPEVIDADTLNRAVRIIVGLVQQIDATEKDERSTMLPGNQHSERNNA